MHTPLYKLTCRQCNETTKVPHCHCASCGPVEGHFSGTPPDFSGVFSCVQCLRPLPQSEASVPHTAGVHKKTAVLPVSCPFCQSHDLGWQLDDKTWHAQAIMPLTGSNGPWVTGNFDGDYIGTASGGNGDPLAPHRTYPIEILRGSLTDVKYVAGPPEFRAAEASMPIQQKLVNEVYIQPASVEGEPDTPLYAMALDDFRLHQWSTTSDEIQSKTGWDIVGRLRGVAYGRLILPIKKTKLPVKQEIPKTVPVLNPPIPKDEQGGKAPLAPDSVTPKPVTPETVPPPIKKNVTGPEAECNTCNLFLLAGVLFLLTVACSFMMGIVGIIPLVIQCVWRKIRQQSVTVALSKIKETLWGAALCALALAIFVHLSQVLAAQGCAGWFNWWLIALGVVLILTALFRHCWSWIFILAFWVCALILSCKDVNQECGKKPANDSIPVIETATQAVVTAIHRVESGIKDKLAADHDAQIVTNQTSSGDEDGRISVEQALSNPDKYFSCFNKGSANKPNPQYNIYFGESALFDFKEETLSPNAKAYLGKLGRLIATRPNAKIILTGHTDQIGTPMSNLQLSERRAQALANWLIENNIMQASQIDIRGAGDQYPVVGIPALYRLNRRVEMRIDCSIKNTGH